MTVRRNGSRRTLEARPVVRAALPAALIYAASVAFVAGPAGPPSKQRPLAVMLTDSGVEIDDQWALAHLALSPSIDLRAVISTHASTIEMGPDQTAVSVAAVLKQVLPADRTGPIVVTGSWRGGTRRERRLGSTPAEIIRTIAAESSGDAPVLVLVTGAATDLAEAIRADPKIATRLKAVAMAFTRWPDGGDLFNVKNDPEAWRTILDSDVPLVLGSESVAREHLSLTREAAARLVGAHGASGKYLYHLFDRWLTDHGPLAEVFAPRNTWVVWDEIVTAYVLGFATTHRVPRPRLRDDLSFLLAPTERRIEWITGVDAHRLWRDLEAKLIAHAQGHRR